MNLSRLAEQITNPMDAQVILESQRYRMEHFYNRTDIEYRIYGLYAWEIEPDESTTRKNDTSTSHWVQ